MKPEIWRDTEYPNYQVSNLGRVYSVPRISINGRKSIPGKILSWNDNGRGYQTCMLTIDGKQKRAYIHRLVAKAFIPNPDNKREVNHIDGNKNNNCVENLEWVTRIENAIHLRDVLGYKHPAPTDEQKEKIRTTVKKLWASGTYANMKKVEYTPEYREKCRKAQLNSTFKKRGAQHHASKPVMCVETGKVYECIKYAARDAKCSRWTIRNSAETNKAYKGFHWKFI